MALNSGYLRMLQQARDSYTDIPYRLRQHLAAQVSSLYRAEYERSNPVDEYGRPISAADWYTSSDPAAVAARRLVLGMDIDASGEFSDYLGGMPTSVRDVQDMLVSSVYLPATGMAIQMGQAWGMDQDTVQDTIQDVMLGATSSLYSYDPTKGPWSRFALRQGHSIVTQQWRNPASGGRFERDLVSNLNARVFRPGGSAGNVVSNAYNGFPAISAGFNEGLEGIGLSQNQWQFLEDAVFLNNGRNAGVTEAEANYVRNMITRYMPKGVPAKFINRLNRIDDPQKRLSFLKHSFAKMASGDWDFTNIDESQVAIPLTKLFPEYQRTEWTDALASYRFPQQGIPLGGLYSRTGRLFNDQGGLNTIDRLRVTGSGGVVAPEGWKQVVMHQDDVQGFIDMYQANQLRTTGEPNKEFNMVSGALSYIMRGVHGGGYIGDDNDSYLNTMEWQGQTWSNSGDLRLRQRQVGTGDYGYMVSYMTNGRSDLGVEDEWQTLQRFGTKGTNLMPFQIGGKARYYGSTDAMITDPNGLPARVSGNLVAEGRRAKEIRRRALIRQMQEVDPQRFNAVISGARATGDDETAALFEDVAANPPTSSDIFWSNEMYRNLRTFSKQLGLESEIFPVLAEGPEYEHANQNSRAAYVTRNVNGKPVRMLGATLRNAQGQTKVFPMSEVNAALESGGWSAVNADYDTFDVGDTELIGPRFDTGDIEDAVSAYRSGLLRPTRSVAAGYESSALLSNQELADLDMERIVGNYERGLNMMVRQGLNYTQELPGLSYDPAKKRTRLNRRIRPLRQIDEENRTTTDAGSAAIERSIRAEEEAVVPGPESNRLSRDAAIEMRAAQVLPFEGRVNDTTGQIINDMNKRAERTGRHPIRPAFDQGVINAKVRERETRLAGRKPTSTARQYVQANARSAMEANAAAAGDSPRAQAIARAQGYMARDPVFIDTETTGLHANDQILEISVVDKEGNLLLNSLVKPTVPINPKAQKVHGIGEADVANAPAWDEVWPQVEALTKGRPVGMYNAEFDERMINQTNQAFDIDPEEPMETFDAMKLFAEYRGEKRQGSEEFKWAKLSEAGAHMGIQEESDLHRTAADTKLTQAVVAGIAGADPGDPNLKKGARAARQAEPAPEAAAAQTVAETVATAVKPKRTRKPRAVPTSESPSVARNYAGSRGEGVVSGNGRAGAGGPPTYIPPGGAPPSGNGGPPPNEPPPPAVVPEPEPQGHDDIDSRQVWDNVRSNMLNARQNLKGAGSVQNALATLRKYGSDAQVEIGGKLYTADELENLLYTAGTTRAEADAFANGVPGINQPSLTRMNQAFFAYQGAADVVTAAGRGTLRPAFIGGQPVHPNIRPRRATGGLTFEDASERTYRFDVLDEEGNVVEGGGNIVGRGRFPLEAAKQSLAGRNFPAGSRLVGKSGPDGVARMQFGYANTLRRVGQYAGGEVGDYLGEMPGLNLRNPEVTLAGGMSGKINVDVAPREAGMVPVQVDGRNMMVDVSAVTGYRAGEGDEPFRTPIARENMQLTHEQEAAVAAQVSRKYREADPLSSRSIGAEEIASARRAESVTSLSELQKSIKRTSKVVGEGQQRGIQATGEDRVELLRGAGDVADVTRLAGGDLRSIMRSGVSQMLTDSSGNVTGAQYIGRNGEVVIGAGRVAESVQLARQGISAATTAASAGQLSNDPEEFMLQASNIVHDTINKAVRKQVDNVKKAFGEGSTEFAQAREYEKEVTKLSKDVADSVLKQAAQKLGVSSDVVWRDSSTMRHKLGNIGAALQNDPELEGAINESYGSLGNFMGGGGGIVTTSRGAYEFEPGRGDYPGGGGPGGAPRGHGPSTLFNSPVGRAMYAAWIMQAGWKQTIVPQLENVQQYAAYTAQFGGLVAGFGGGVPVMATEAGYNVRAEQASRYWQQGSFDQLSGFGDISWATSRTVGPWLPRLKSGLTVAGGMAITGAITNAGGAAIAGAMGEAGAGLMAATTAAGSLMLTGGVVAGGAMLGLEGYNAYQRATGGEEFTLSGFSEKWSKMMLGVEARERYFQKKGLNPYSFLGGKEWGAAQRAFTYSEDQIRKYLSPSEAAFYLGEGEELQGVLKEFQETAADIQGITGEDQASAAATAMAVARALPKGTSSTQVNTLTTQMAMAASAQFMSSAEYMGQATQYATQMGYLPGSFQFQQVMQDWGRQGGLDELSRALQMRYASRISSAAGQIGGLFANTGAGYQIARDLGLTRQQDISSAQSVLASFAERGVDLDQMITVDSGNMTTQVSMGEYLASMGLQQNQLQTRLLAGVSGDLYGGGMFTPQQALGMVTGMGFTDSQAMTFAAAAGGNMKAMSYNAWQNGTYANRFFDQAGRAIYQHDGRGFLNMMRANGAYSMGLGLFQQVSNTGTAPVGAMAADYFSGFGITPNAGLDQAFEQGGTFGMQQEYRSQAYGYQMAAIGVQMEGLRQQEQYLWGGGSWSSPEKGSRWWLEDQMRKLQRSSEDAQLEASQERFDTNRIFAERQEALSWERMGVSQDFQRWSMSFDRSTQQLQQQWTKEDWQYQDTMRGLQNSWQMEDIDEQIRYSHGRQRKQLIKQKERMALSQNLQEEQVETQRDRQEELWAREDERYEKQREYSEAMMELDVKQFELNKEHRLALQALDEEDLKRREDEMKKSRKYEDQMIALEREHQMNSIELSKQQLGIQAAQATLAKDLEDRLAVVEPQYEEVTGMVEQTAQWGEKAITVLRAYQDAIETSANTSAEPILEFKAAIGSLGTLLLDKPRAVNSMIQAINTLNTDHIRFLIELINSTKGW